ncbi:hypothetical protein L596_000212 [Steinernema carpocapsae]|uniref:Uncharacterized protein n=1 Tax=Steinernema carpocapsae TaxID=34508 RepID=A0A4U8UHE9_STECR|nr:hypothetical protein L596_000212 [Steinernema carpocapsae]
MKLSLFVPVIVFSDKKVKIEGGCRDSIEILERPRRWVKIYFYSLLPAPQLLINEIRTTRKGRPAHAHPSWPPSVRKGGHALGPKFDSSTRRTRLFFHN